MPGGVAGVQFTRTAPYADFGVGLNKNKRSGRYRGMLGRFSLGGGGLFGGLRG